MAELSSRISVLKTSESNLSFPVLDPSELNAEDRFKQLSLSVLGEIITKQSWTPEFSGSYPTEIRSVLENSIIPEMVGTVPTGTEDCADIINETLQIASIEGKQVLLPSREYYIESRIIIPSNTTLIGLAGNKIVRAWTSVGNGAPTATIGQESYLLSDKIVDVSMIGIVTGAADETKTGVNLAFWGDRIFIEGHKCFGYYGGLYMSLGGDDITIKRCSAFDPLESTGTGGIRVYGGHRFNGSDCYVESGDDSLQLVPLSTGERANLSIYDAKWTNCHGISTNARVAIAACDENLTAVIKNFHFKGITGKSKNRAGKFSHEGLFLGSVSSMSRSSNITTMVLSDVTTSGYARFGVGETIIVNGASPSSFNGAKVILSVDADDVTFTLEDSGTDGSASGIITASRIPKTLINGKVEMSVDQSESTWEREAITIGAGADIEAVLNVNQPNLESLRITGTKAKARIYGGFLDAPRSSDSPTLSVAAGGSLLIRDTEIVGNGGTASPVLLGTGNISNAADRVKLDNVDITGIGNSKFGLSSVFASMVDIRNSRFRQANGAAAKAIQIQAGTNYYILENNDMSELSASASLLISALGVEGREENNRGYIP